MPAQQDPNGCYTAFCQTEGHLPGAEQYRTLSEKALSIGGLEAYTIYGEIVAAGNGAVLRCAQTFIPCGDKIYIFSAGCFREDWERDKPIFDKIVLSFRVK